MDLARRRLVSGGVLIVVGVVLGGALLATAQLRPAVVAEPISVGSEAVVIAEEPGQLFAIYSSDPASMADGCRVTTANGRAVTLVRVPSTEQIEVRGTLLHRRQRFEAPDAVRLTVVCPNPASTFVGLDDPFGRNTTALVLGWSIGGALTIGGLVLVARALLHLRRPGRSDGVGPPAGAPVESPRGAGSDVGP